MHDMMMYRLANEIYIYMYVCQMIDTKLNVITSLNRHATLPVECFNLIVYY